MIEKIELEVPGAKPPPEAYLVLGFMVGVVVVSALLSSALRRREARRERAFGILLPDYAVFRHCFCGYPSKNLHDLEGHLVAMHPHLPAADRADILFPQPSEGSE
jgi:hypothetical protein